MYKKSLESGDSVIQVSSVYHFYSVPTILQVVTPISFLKKVILYRLQSERLLSTLLHLIYFFNSLPENVPYDFHETSPCL